MNRIKTYIFIGLIVCASMNLFAQEEETIKKEVRVVKPYEPTLTDAFKINLLPVLDDTVKLSPDISYSIQPNNFQPVYQFKPLKPAKLEGEQIPKLYHSYLKLGFGTNLTPVGEISISNLRSKTFSIGAYIRHISSYGDVKLANNKKVYASYGDTDFLFHTKKVFKKSVLSVEAGVNQDWINYYGYNPSLDTTLLRDSTKQSFLDIYGGLNLESTHLDSNHLNYKIQANYHHFNDKFKNSQDEVNFYARFNKVFLKNKMFGIDLKGMYLGSNMDSLTTPLTIVRVEPWFSQSTPLWRLDLALDLTFEFEPGNSILHLYPKARFHFNVVPQFLTAFVGVKGELQNNTYRSAVSINPYQIPGLNMKSTDKKMNFFGGFNGSFSRKSAYHIRASYSLVDQMPFFVNDTLDVLGNKFYFEYDDVQITRVFGEASTKIGPNAEIFLKANYYKYGMSTQARAWNKPNFDATVSFRYNFRNKILGGIDAYYVGKRYAKSYVFAQPEIPLDGFVDLNLSLEYQFTRILSFYIRLNNILGSGYEIWNQYPVQRFSFFAGFSYLL